MRAMALSGEFPGRLIAFDVGLLAAQIAELVDPVQQAMARKCLDREGDDGTGGQRQPGSLEIDVDLGAGMLHQPGRGGLIHGNRQQSVFQRIAAKDVGNLGADDGAKSVVQERPGRMLARGAAAEVAARYQHAAVARRRGVQHEVRIRHTVRPIAPIGEQLLAQPFLGGRRQETSRDDLIGVHVAGRYDDGAGAHTLQGFHHMSSLGSVILPRTALAAAVSGLASKVRAPTPCRPSKLRLLVLTAYWPAGTVSPFIPKHMEHPDSRQSAPAVRKMSARPDASASCLICCEPGTISRRTPGATRRPLRICAAAFKSSSRPLVQLPMNTTFTGFPAMASPR